MKRPDEEDKKEKRPSLATMDFRKREVQRDLPPHSERCQDKSATVTEMRQTNAFILEPYDSQSDRDKFLVSEPEGTRPNWTEIGECQDRHRAAEDASKTGSSVLGTPDARYDVHIREKDR